MVEVEILAMSGKIGYFIIAVCRAAALPCFLSFSCFLLRVHGHANPKPTHRGFAVRLHSQIFKI